MEAFRKTISGRQAEDLAVRFLEEKGFKIIQRNYYSPQGEIDIVAQEKDVLCFVEVRARSTDYRVHPLETIHPSKMRRIVQTAQWYLLKNDVTDLLCRFDVVAIIEDKKDVQIDLIKDVVSLDK
jgi:putative endonuclease